MLDLKNVAHEAQTADIQVIVTKMEQGLYLQNTLELVAMQHADG